MFSANFHRGDLAVSRRDSDPMATALGQLGSNKRAIVLGSMLGVFIALGVAGAAIDVHEQLKIRSTALAVIAKPLERVADINSAFQELHTLNSRPCSAAHLATLRSIAFRSTIIRDVTYQGARGLRCSGNLGSSASTIQLHSPDFISESGRQIWRNIDLPLSPGVKSTLVKEGAYELLIAPENQPVSVHGGYYALSIVLLNKTNRTILLVRGADPGVDQHLLETGSTYWRHGELLSVACLPGQTTCYVLRAERASLIMSNAMLLVLAAIFSFIVTAAGVASLLARRFRSSTIDAWLRTAVQRKELFMHYQPIVDNRTGVIVSAEALMRWTIRTGEIVSPAIFIPIAEENDLIGELTCLALQRVSEDFGSFLRDHKDFKISVNVVTADMVDVRFHRSLRCWFEEKGISASQLAFELTERTAAKFDSAVMALRELGARGYEIYIDDFGTGYANLSYLSDLRADKIKLDKKFTDTVGSGSLRERIVPSVIELARELGIEIIVEGIESADQVDYFRARGVHLMQGWFYGRPLPSVELIGKLNLEQGMANGVFEQAINTRVGLMAEQAV